MAQGYYLGRPSVTKLAEGFGRNRSSPSALSTAAGTTRLANFETAVCDMKRSKNMLGQHGHSGQFAGLPISPRSGIERSQATNVSTSGGGKRTLCPCVECTNCENRSGTDGPSFPQ